MKSVIEMIDKQIKETEAAWQQSNQQKLSMEKTLEVLNDELSQLKGRRTALLETRELILKEEAEEQLRKKSGEDKPALENSNNQLPKKGN